MLKENWKLNIHNFFFKKIIYQEIFSNLNYSLILFIDVHNVYLGRKKSSYQCLWVEQEWKDEMEK